MIKKSLAVISYFSDFPEIHFKGNDESLILSFEKSQLQKYFVENIPPTLIL